MEEEIVLMEENDIEEINIEEENYSGKPYELPIASADTLGGIKVGNNLTIDEDGTLNATGGGTGNVDLTDYAKKSELPTKTSQLTNDSNFINSIKTINGQSLEGEGNIVIEDGSSGTSNVVVSPTEPINGEEVWFQKKVNLFNKDTAIKTGRLLENGVLMTASNETCASDFIKVEPNTQYTIQGITDEGGITIPWYNCYYDENKQIISSYRVQKGTYTITTPENAYYIRFTIHKNDLNQFQFEKGSTASDYTKYVENKIYTLNKNTNEYEEFEISENDTGWLDGTTVVGEWATFRYRKIGSKVLFEGRIASLTPSTNLVLGTIPIEYAPTKQMFTYGYTAGTTITRYTMKTTGEIVLSFAFNFLDGTEITTPNYHHVYFEYYLD